MVSQPQAQPVSSDLASDHSSIPQASEDVRRNTFKEKVDQSKNHLSWLHEDDQHLAACR
jgi:hypothetical protein